MADNDQDQPVSPTKSATAQEPDPGTVPDAKNALKGILRDAFDSRNRMRHVKPNDRLPIVRRSKGKIDLGPVCTTDH